ncbi:hypothetical protein H8356DRAFT_1322910, partial [Neocallimastix lanati (nom. inval.)]
MTNTSWCKPIEFSPFCVSIPRPAVTIEAPPLHVTKSSISKIRTLVQWLVTLTMTNTSWKVKDSFG